MDFSLLSASWLDESDPFPPGHRPWGEGLGKRQPRRDCITEPKRRIDLYKRGGFVLESNQSQVATAGASKLELAAREAGVIPKKKSWQPVGGTGAWDNAMVKARGQALRGGHGRRRRDSGDLCVVGPAHRGKVDGTYLP